MKNEKALSIGFLAFAFILFFHNLLFRGYGFYYGDYKQQFYPWAFELYQHVHRLSLPLWTSKIGCGFPLLAEGQGGALYPLQWLIYLLLPFSAAYNILFILFFAVSAAFMIFYCRKCGMGMLAAAFSAACFLFGSAYAGLFFGMAALRTGLLFAPMLYFSESFFEEGELRSLLIFSLCVGLSLLGGYPQLVLYMVMASGASGLLHRGFASKSVKWFMALLLGVGLGACQVLPTLELLSYSARAGSDLDFALQKSFNPLNVLTLAWPGWGVFMGADLYLGVLPLCLAIFVVFYGQKNKRIKFFALFLLTFLLLAFGRFNPLYSGAIKLLHLYFLRTPSKFLFFVCFALSYLAGAGLDLLIKKNSEFLRPFIKMLFLIFFAAVGVFTAAHFMARNGSQMILDWAERYVRHFIYGRTGHPHSLEEYLGRLPGLIDYVASRSSFTDVYFLKTLFIWALLAAGFMLINSFKKNKAKAVIFFAAAVTLLDLYAYSAIGSGFLGNCVKPETVTPDKIARHLSAEKDKSRVYELITDPVEGSPRWIANSNMFLGYDSIGLYSPLAIDAYREYLKELGGVDNSSGVYTATKEALIKNKALLAKLNVGYVLAHENLGALPGMDEVARTEEGDYLYKTAQREERAFLIPESSGKLEANFISDEKVIFKTSTDKPSKLFRSEVFYPGWTARLDGIALPIEKADGVFQAVNVPPGQHEIYFSFEPKSFRAGCFLSALSLLILAVLWGRKKSVRKAVR